MPLVANRNGMEVMIPVIIGDMLAPDHPAPVPKAYSIWHIDLDNPPGSQYPQYFPHDRKMGMGEMLQYLTADRGIEGVIRKREGINFAVAHPEMNCMSSVDAGIPFGLIGDIQGVALVAQMAKKAGEHPLTGPHIQNFRIGLQPKGNVAKAIDATPKEVLQFVVFPRIELSSSA